MNALITGVNGFVGNHLAESLISKGIQVYGFDLNDNSIIKGITYSKADVTNIEEVQSILNQTKFDYIFHLVGFSSVADSFSDKENVFSINVNGTKNLLEAITNAKQQPVVLVASTAHVYGKPEKIPIAEDHPVNCFSPYAESKYLCEKAAIEFFEKHGLKSIIVRNFNIIGPGQSEKFVCSSFAKQIADIEVKNIKPELHVGNLEAERDFTDVMDVVVAYLLLAEKGTPGEIYNLGYGKSYPISHILNTLLGYSTVEINVVNDPERTRPSDMPVLRADASKLRKATGWSPEIKLKDSLKNTLDYWRKKVKNASSTPELQ